MKFLKNVLLWLINLYIKPLKTKPQPYTYLKYEHFSGILDHLYGTISFLKNLHLPNITMLDIGVADGETSLLFVQSFKNIKIVGFEPIPNAFKLAQKKVKNYPNVILHNLALSSKIGVETFYVTNNSDSSSLLAPTDIGYENVSLSSTIEVQTSILDKEVKDLDSITLIKLDTQGTELIILQNGLETLKKTRFVLAEMSIPKQYEGACQYYELDEFLRKQGFVLVGLFARIVGIIEYDALYENINHKKLSIK
jgi:FkbM family methyltransferase